MKFHTTFVLLLVGQLLFAQSFTEKPGTPFYPNASGVVLFSDIDGDNDEDILITSSGSGFFHAILYKNDGMGNYTEVTGTPFQNVHFSSAEFADVDGDNDEDLLIAGRDNLFSQATNLYINDGLGNFSLKPGTSFDGVESAAIRFSDVDGDNDEDVLITGTLVAGGTNPSAKLYLNDGLGNFTNVNGTPFTNAFGDARFSDVDGDNDEDILIVGSSTVNTKIAELYINDGQGNFSLKSGTPFEPANYCAIAFSDVDGDNDQDVVIIGSGNLGSPMAKLYSNDGQGNFTEQLGTPFTPVINGALAFADIDGDNHQDLLLTGFSSVNGLIAKLYSNDGAGNFTELTGQPFDGVDASSVAFSDVNGDGDQDVLIAGQISAYMAIAKLYLNDLISNNMLADEMKLDFSVFPNPVINNKINISFESTESGELTIHMYDLNGRLIQQQSKQLEQGDQTFSIQIPTLPKGDYIIEFDHGKQKGSRIFSIN